MIERYIRTASRITSNISRQPILDALTILRKTELLFVCGNGGSYATASHIVGDLLLNAPWFLGQAYAIGDNLTYFSATANDKEYDQVFRREIERRLPKVGSGRTTVLLLTTSGTSKNILKAAKWCREQQLSIISMVGRKAGTSGVLAEYSDVVIMVDSHDVGIVESIHSLIGHLFVEALKNEDFLRLDS